MLLSSVKLEFEQNLRIRYVEFTKRKKFRRHAAFSFLSVSKVIAYVNKYSDKELVEKCLKGKARYQRALYDKYSGLIYALCYRYAKNPEDAKDLLQEAFIRIFNNLEKFKGEGSFEGWIKRIAVNCAIRHYENSVKKIDSGDIETSPEYGDSETILSSIGVQEIMKLINQLPDGYRLILNMYTIEGYSHKEIAESLSITESSSRSQLTRARKLLMDLIRSSEKRTMAC